MKTILFPTTALAVAITIMTLASSAAQDPNWIRPGTEEAAALDAADKQIDAVYQKLMQALDAEAQSSLREAQRAWIKWRDEEAMLIARLGGAVGGSALRVDILNAQADLVRARTAVLQGYLKRAGEN